MAGVGCHPSGCWSREILSNPDEQNRLFSFAFCYPSELNDKALLLKTPLSHRAMIRQDGPDLELSSLLASFHGAYGVIEAAEEE